MTDEERAHLEDCYVQALTGLVHAPAGSREEAFFREEALRLRGRLDGIVPIRKEWMHPSGFPLETVVPLPPGFDEERACASICEAVNDGEPPVKCGLTAQRWTGAMLIRLWAKTGAMRYTLDEFLSEAEMDDGKYPEGLTAHIQDRMVFQMLKAMGRSEEPK